MTPQLATPLKEAELRKLARCSACEKLIGETGMPVFFKATLEKHFINAAAVQRQQGLTNLLGGSATLALAMSADEDMTFTIDPGVTVMICGACAMHEVCLLEIFERALTAQFPTPAP